jgi:hypothetical protein
MQEVGGAGPLNGSNSNLVERDKGLKGKGGETHMGDHHWQWVLRLPGKGHKSKYR